MAQKNKSGPAIGLDIGTYSIKCVEVSWEAGVYRLQRVAILPLNAPQGELPKTEDIQKALKGLFETFGGHPGSLRISVTGPSLLMRPIKLPVMTPAELKGAILFEAESQIPFPVNDCLLEFQILGTAADGKNMNVLLVAAKKDFIQERLKLLSALNVAPEIIDVDIFCLMNAFEILGEGTAQKTYGLLDIGYSVSSLAILRDKLPFVVRDIPVGDSGISQCLSGLKGLPEAEADRLKIDCPEDLREDLKNAIIKGTQPLVEEIKHSVDYFENETGESLKDIFVSGGGALTEGLTAIFSEELGMRVGLWDNLKKLDISPGVDRKYLTGHSQELNVALGLALRKQGQKE